MPMLKMTRSGAYYYYHTEPNKTYEDTMLDVKAYLEKAEVPARSLQFDRYVAASRGVRARTGLGGSRPSACGPLILLLPTLPAPQLVVL